jgi:molecular chaperone DnaK
MVADNKSLGKFQLTGLPPAPRGIPQIDVTFNIDADGILHVTAKDKATEKTASITIKDSSRLDTTEIERMRREAEVHAEDDRKKTELVELRNRADQLVYSVEKALADLGAKVDGAKRSEIEDRMRVLREKLGKDATSDELKRAMDDLSKSASEVVAKAYEASHGAPAGSPDSTATNGGTADGGKDEGEYIDAEYDKP